MTYIYDPHLYRHDFPILAQKVHGQPLVYLDNAASAQKPRQVISAMSQMYETSYANVHRGLYHLANEATSAYERARETVCRFINAEKPENILFTKNATEGLNLIAATLGMEFAEGDEVILSVLEHHSNIVPWHFLRERKGVVLRWVPVDSQGNLRLDEMEHLFSNRTRAVAITHMSNALGTIVPLERVIRMAHAHSVPVVVDGTQGAVHLDVDVQVLGADFYVFTGHKLYGPSGIGVVYGKSHWLERLSPFLGGGEMIESVTLERVTYAAPPMRFEAGTPPIVEAVGLAAALDYVEAVGKDHIRAHEQQLTIAACERLRDISGLRFTAQPFDQGPILSFAIKGAHPHDLATLLDRQGIAVRAGTHCAMPLLQQFGVTATCRASFGLYNTQHDIEALAAALEKAQTLFQ